MVEVLTYCPHKKQLGSKAHCRVRAVYGSLELSHGEINGGRGFTVLEGDEDYIYRQLVNMVIKCSKHPHLSIAEQSECHNKILAWIEDLKN